MRLIDADTIPYRTVYEPDENGKYKMVKFVYEEEVDKLSSYSLAYILTHQKEMLPQRGENK